METIQNLVDRRAKVWKEIESLNDNLAEGKFDAETEEKFDRLDKEYQRLDKQIGNLEEKKAIEDANADELEKNNANASESEKYSKVFSKFVSKGYKGLNSDEYDLLESYNKYHNAAEQTITTSGGGYIIPQEFQAEIDKQLAHYGPFSLSGNGPGRYVFTNSGAPLKWPTINDTANTGQNLAINTDATTSSTALTFGEKDLGAVVITSDVIQVPRQLVQDEGIGFPSVLGELLAERVGRRFNNKCTLDDGEAGEFTSGFEQAASEGVVTAADDAITSNEILDLYYSVDKAYRDMPQAGFMCHDLIAKEIRKLTVTSSADQYLWEPSFKAGEPSTLLGKPLYVNNDLDSTLAGDNRTLFFGDWSKFVIRVVRGMELMRMDERFAEKYQVGWAIFARADCNLLNSNAIKFVRQLTT